MKCLITFGYENFVIDQDNLTEVLAVFQNVVEVSSEYVNSQYVYAPKKEKKELKIELIEDDRIRPLTDKEKEAKEISSLKSTLSYKEGLLKTEQERTKALACELELLKTQSDGKED